MSKVIRGRTRGDIGTRILGKTIGFLVQGYTKKSLQWFSVENAQRSLCKIDSFLEIILQKFLRNVWKKKKIGQKFLESLWKFSYKSFNVVHIGTIRLLLAILQWFYAQSNSIRNYQKKSWCYFSEYALFIYYAHGDS